MTYTGHLVLLEHSYLVSDGRQPYQNYPYFYLVMGLEWSKDADCYANGSIDTGRVSLHVHMSRVMTLTIRNTQVFQVGGWAWTNQMLRNLRKEKPDGCSSTNQRRTKE